ncbi:MAG: hypothetical protein MK033_01490 [Candidatus Caenarcaniphilales bacterium]|nr:hypothetical protein [Candidatus Caenarcaniphilales bacterium]
MNTDCKTLEDVCESKSMRRLDSLRGELVCEQLKDHEDEVLESFRDIEQINTLLENRQRKLF